MKNGVAVAAEFTGLPEPQSREKSGEKNESQIFLFITAIGKCRGKDRLRKHFACIW